MPQTGGKAEDLRHSWLDGQLRDRIPEIAEEAATAILPILQESWNLGQTDITPSVHSYVSALVESVERGSSVPIEEHLASLDTLWQAEQFAIAPIIRSMFLIDDITREHLPETGRSEGERLVQQYTRTAVEIMSRRSVSIVTNRLADQVRLHRDGEARLISLQRVSAALVRDLDLDRSMSLIADEARRLIGADGVGIRLTHDNESLGFIAGSGDDRQILRRITALPVGESLSGAVLRSCTPIRVDDVRHDSRVSTRFVEQSDGRSLLIAPLIARDQPIGIIGGTSTRTAAFSEQDEDLLVLFADQAASAIQNATLYKQAQDQIAELEMLHRVSRVVSSSLELHEIFQSLYEEVERIMPADAFLVALSRPDGLFDVEFIIDSGQRYPPNRGVGLSPMLRDGVREGRLMVINDVADHDFHGRLQRVGNVEQAVLSLIAAPLIRGNEVIGMVSAQSYEGHDYREPESRMLQTIASQAAIAIEHARLYQQAQNLAIAEERARLAREIHDTLAQGLIGIILCLERLDLTVPSNDEYYRPWVERALDLSRSSLEEARRSVRDLRAAPLEGRTLLEAIANLAATLEKEAEFEVETKLPPTLPPLSARVETALFRVVQEAVTNARKHAECSMLGIHLGIDNDALRLTITDDGVGFAPQSLASPADHYGLTTMHERVQQIGGDIQIESVEGNGTNILVSVPTERALHQESQYPFQNQRQD
jgi:signal transduction histidine kinase